MQRCAEPWRTRVDIPVMVLLVTVTLAIAWLSRTVLVTSDPWHYAQAALNFGTHQWIPSGIDPLGDHRATDPGGSGVRTDVADLLRLRVLGDDAGGGRRLRSGQVGGTTADRSLTVVVFVAQPLTLLNLSRGYPDLMAVALNGLTPDPGHWRASATRCGCW